MQCLAAVEPQLQDVHGASVTVVDNGSHDGTVTAVATRFPHAKLFALKENRGFTGGLAAALRGSTADLVVFLNNDAIPEPGWLIALVNAMGNAPGDVMSVGGKIVDLSGMLIDFIGGAMTFDGHAFQNGFRYPLGSREEPAAGAEILFACGGNMITRRSLLEITGGFDDDYFAYLEDVDFGWRSWLAGYRVLYEPAALVRHKSAATSDRLGSFERGVLFERNALQTVLKNYGDDVLRDASASIFYTYLSRLHHYASRRNERAGELVRDPFSGRPLHETSPGLLGRIRRRIFGSKPLAAIDDPLTTMQFRAFEWIVQNDDRIADKRARIQALRKRSDDEIFKRFPLLVVPTYPGDDALMSGALFRLLRPRLPAVDRALGDIIAT
jgi:GT2 family glycosyltransferase